MNQDERREQLRQRRRDAYQAGKERQRTDPKYIALKEKKVMRRENYQQQKQQRKDYISAQKRSKQDEKAEHKKARNEELAQSLFRAKDLMTEGQSTFQGDKHS